MTHKLSLGFAAAFVTASLSLAFVHGCSSSSSSDGGGGGIGAGGGASPADFCKKSCARAQACDSSIDMQTCQDECGNSAAVLVPKLRADVVASIEACVDKKDCRTVNAGHAVSECQSEAVASI